MKELHCSKSLLFYYFVKHFSIRIQQCIKSYLALYCILLSMTIWILVSSVREGWISFYSQRHLSCYIGDFFVSPIEFSELCAAWKLLIRCIYKKNSFLFIHTYFFLQNKDKTVTSCYQLRSLRSFTRVRLIQGNPLKRSLMAKRNWKKNSTMQVDALGYKPILLKTNTSNTIWDKIIDLEII